MKIKKIINNPIMPFIYLTDKYGIIKYTDDFYLKNFYKYKTGKKLNLNKPKSFNEKMQWLKLYDRNPKYTKMVDKYEAKKYVASLIGEDYIIPTIGVYDRFEDIDFDKLPNQFVLKCTHDSGGLIICKDKKDLNIKKARKKINKCLKRNFYYFGREWPYKNVKPRIIIEKYMGDKLNDYKLMCFNGKVKCSFVCSDRRSENGLAIDIYDINWVHLPLKRHCRNSDRLIEKPKKYEEMIKLAEFISKNITFLRVDFYEIKGKVYFGELTFYPGSGFEEFNPEKWNYIMGDWINLDNNLTLK